MEREIEGLTQALKDRISALDVRDSLNALSAKKAALKRELELVPDPKPLLHPGMADPYRAKILNLREALDSRMPGRLPRKPFAASSTRLC
jgi:hypothetical protein